MEPLICVRQRDLLVKRYKWDRWNNRSPVRLSGCPTYPWGQRVTPLIPLLQAAEPMIGQMDTGLTNNLILRH